MEDCLTLDLIDATYAFDRNKLIACNTTKDPRKGSYSLLKRSRSAGIQVAVSTCQIINTFYEMYRGESRIQL